MLPLFYLLGNALMLLVLCVCLAASTTLARVVSAFSTWAGHTTSRSHR